MSLKPRPVLLGLEQRIAILCYSIQQLKLSHTPIAQKGAPVHMQHSSPVSHEPQPLPHRTSGRKARRRRAR